MGLHSFINFPQRERKKSIAAAVAEASESRGMLSMLNVPQNEW